MAHDDISDNLSQSNIDLVYSFITQFDGLSGDFQGEFSKLLLQLVSNAQIELSSQTPMNQKQSFKIIFYFFIQMCMKLDQVLSKKSKDDELQTQWRNVRFKALEHIVAMFQIEPSSMWNMSMIPENFITPIWQYGLYLLETRPLGISGMSMNDQQGRQLCISIIQSCTFVSNECVIEQLVTAIINGICQYEHLTRWIAEMVANANTIFVSTLMTELSHMTFNDNKESNEDENKSHIPKLMTPAKHVGLFLINWTELNPSMSSKYLPLVLHQLASDAHQIRHVSSFNETYFNFL